MRLNCYECGKPVTTDLPKQVTIRASLTCPECIEKQLSKKEILEMIEEIAKKLRNLKIDDSVSVKELSEWVLEDLETIEKEIKQEQEKK